MAKQDDYVRVTIRIPKDLHADLTALAGPRSLNAEIIERLDDSVETEGRKIRMRDFAFGNKSSDQAPGNTPQDKVAALIERIKHDAERVAMLSELFLPRMGSSEPDSD